jgi:hypothetical protein
VDVLQEQRDPRNWHGDATLRDFERGLMSRFEGAKKADRSKWGIRRSNGELGGPRKRARNSISSALNEPTGFMYSAPSAGGVTPV